MILILSFGKNQSPTLNTDIGGLIDGKSLLECETVGQAPLCYGATVAFSIIVSGDILRKLLSDQKLTIDRIDMFYNVLAIILFTTLGFTRVEKNNGKLLVKRIKKN